MIPRLNETLDPVFLSAVKNVEEARRNAMVGAEGITGKRGRRVAATDHAELAASVMSHSTL